MTDKELRKLRRIDLLEMLVAQGKENERLQQRVEELEQQLADKRILVQNAGSLAQAALELNHVFQTAQDAADQYIENLARMEQEAKERAARTEQAADSHEEISEETAKQMHSYEDFMEEVTEQLHNYEELAEEMAEEAHSSDEEFVEEMAEESHSSDEESAEEMAEEAYSNPEEE